MSLMNEKRNSEEMDDNYKTKKSQETFAEQKWWLFKDTR